MPSYLSSGGLGGMNRNGSCCCDDNSMDRNSAIFFNQLATKLLEMSKSFQERLEEARKNCNQQQAGFLFASIDTPQMAISVGTEYIIYVQRFGPPPNGKFPPEKLAQIRMEFNIPSSSI